MGLLLQVNYTGDTYIGESHLVESGTAVAMAIADADSKCGIPVKGERYRFGGSCELDAEFYDTGRANVCVVFSTSDIEADTCV